MAIGDGSNDLGLFEFAAVSVAPSSARAEILAAAYFIVAENFARRGASLLEAPV